MGKRKSTKKSSSSSSSSSSSVATLLIGSMVPPTASPTFTKRPVPKFRVFVHTSRSWKSTIPLHIVLEMYPTTEQERAARKSYYDQVKLAVPNKNWRPLHSYECVSNDVGPEAVAALEDLGGSDLVTVETRDSLLAPMTYSQGDTMLKIWNGETNPAQKRALTTYVSTSMPFIRDISSGDES